MAASKIDPDTISTIIAQWQLGEVWKEISKEPIPDVLAYIFEDRSFYAIMEEFNASANKAEPDSRQVESCMFEYQEHLVVLIKQSANVDACLKHELQQIAVETLMAKKVFGNRLICK